MDLNQRTVLILGGAGLVGLAVARKALAEGPRRLVIGSLKQEEAESAVAELQAEGIVGNAELDAVWGDLFVPASMKDRPREDVLADATARGLLLDDLYSELSEGTVQRSALGKLLLEVRPEILVDCLNTAGALAYRNVFASAAELRGKARSADADSEAVERHLAVLYLPQLIRHTQIALEAMSRVGTQIYVKIGTSGTGGMGLNIPFTHSEERPSRVLLAKAGLAGAQTLLLYLMSRTPGAPSVKEIKPTAAISWKGIGYGPVRRGSRPLTRSDATVALTLDEAFQGDGAGFEELHRPIEGVYIDTGENGWFTLSEFETLTALGLMEFVTPEEIADNVIREIQAHPSGRDVVSALDSATMGPTYRAGVLRSAAIERMEALEAEHGVRAVAYEMLGPPRLSKLLFEAYILERLHQTLEATAALDPNETARGAQALVEENEDLRQRIVSIGLPILLPEGDRVLRGAEVKVPPVPGRALDDRRVVDAGWVDLRPSNWERWRNRAVEVYREIRGRPGVESGSRADVDYGDWSPRIRPGRMAAWILRHEDRGERIKR